MQDINSVVFTGRLTADPELRCTASGRSVSRLRVAIQRAGGGRDRGAAFYDVEVWNGLAESCARYLAKGRRVAVEGRLEHQEWTDNGDRRRQRNYVVATQVNFLDPPPEGEVREEAEPEPATAGNGGTDASTD
jgi:single-strand DNA-binding protein